MECSEAAAELLSSSPRRFDVCYVGPKERLEISPRTLASATLYIQPGGGGLKRGYRAMKSYKKVIREFVGDGGRYVGFCLGATSPVRHPVSHCCRGYRPVHLDLRRDREVN
ncbi:BPL-N domain-containing protein [Saccharopolyspora spinosporotrichia]